MKRIVGLVVVVFCFCFSIVMAATPNERSAAEWFDQGNQYVLQKEYQKAIEAYTKAIEIKPYAEAYIN